MQFNVIFLIVIISLFAPTYEEKKCRIRNRKQLCPIKLFKYVTGQICAANVNANWYHTNLVFNETTEDYENETYSVICALDEQNRKIFLDFENGTVLDFMSERFTKTSYFEKWKLCAYTAKDCCENFLTEGDMQPNIYYRDLKDSLVYSHEFQVFVTNIPVLALVMYYFILRYFQAMNCYDEYVCPALWDGWTCYGKARANTTIEKTCPPYTISADKYVCELQSEKYCLENGWNHKTNYVICAEAPVYRLRHKFHLIVLYVAIGIMIPSVFIYTIFYSKLNNLRVSLHRNLILAILIKNVLVIISKDLVLMDALNTVTNDIMKNNGVACRVLAFFENLSKNVIFTCMSVDAFYLHKMIVRAFAAEPNVYILYGIVAVCSTIPSLIWVTLMAINEKENCWMVDDSWFQWITDGYKYALLIINVFFFFDILRVFITKLGRGATKKQSKSALKATIILLPLFGVPLLITSQRSLVDSEDCLAANIYYYVTYSIEAGQGILLVIYFCYLNKEVHEAICKEFGKFKVYVRQKFNLPELKTRRRTTGVTDVL